MIVLSERNLRVLLAKLEGYPPNSNCMIGGGSGAPGVFVKAEPDDVHYGGRGYPPGVMHPDTEERIVRE